MKYNQYGIPCGLDDAEHLESFMEADEATSYFKRLYDELPWQEMFWRPSKPLPRLVFRYGEAERSMKKYETLEFLRIYVEEVLETKVSGIWCNLYRTGDDYTPYHQDSYNSNVFTLSLGETRKFSARLKRPRGTPLGFRTDYSLKNGDAFYFTTDFNSNHEHTVPKSRKNNGPRISIVFFIGEPYSNGETSKSLPGSETDINLQRHPLHPSFVNIADGNLPPHIAQSIAEFMGVIAGGEFLIYK